MQYKVPFVDIRQHYRNLKPEIDHAIQNVLARGNIILRKDLSDFENSIARFVGTKYAIGVGNGFDALHLSVKAAGIGQGDEVITVAHTFVATIAAIVHNGATPILVDVQRDFTIDPNSFERAITKKTKAVILVHLNGRLCE
ncbi:MAG: aminotransferase class I/II-fold pyridoxal phosphate-dependent enzyme, partial [Candidatus Jacksonbacteria bacterium]|nr:aminotransferase class I/II-fold pyridoxal phosphate-dependent enzyme [Candidatus Jacksonbacteria bacterium]